MRVPAVGCERLFLTLGCAGTLGTSERNVRFEHLVVESPRYHEFEFPPRTQGAPG
jgi:hypothetical protein